MTPGLEYCTHTGNSSRGGDLPSCGFSSPGNGTIKSEDMIKRLVFAFCAFFPMLASCGSGFSFGDPCGWLPEGNQDTFVELIQSVQDEGYTRLEVQGALLQEIATLHGNVYGASPTQEAECLDVLIDEVYGPN